MTGQRCWFLHEWAWPLPWANQWHRQVKKCNFLTFLKIVRIVHFTYAESCCSPIQFLTSGAGSKAWRGDIKGLNREGLNFFYDGQGFMSVQLTKMEAQIRFYDVFGNVLHSWNTVKQLHPSIWSCGINFCYGATWNQREQLLHVRLY